MFNQATIPIRRNCSATQNHPSKDLTLGMIIAEEDAGGLKLIFPFFHKEEESCSGFAETRLPIPSKSEAEELGRLALNIYGETGQLPNLLAAPFIK